MTNRAAFATLRQISSTFAGRKSGGGWLFNLTMKPNDNRVFVTPEGLEKLKKEYQDSVKVKRQAIARRIQNALELGDITENAEYSAARDEQARIEGRILELEDILKNAEVVERKKSSSCVDFGSKVRVHLEGQDQEFHIVGATEADPNEGKISHESPLGRALLGKKVGDSVEIEAPIGRLVYKVLHISFG